MYLSKGCTAKNKSCLVWLRWLFNTVFPHDASPPLIERGQSWLFGCGIITLHCPAHPAMGQWVFSFLGFLIPVFVIPLAMTYIAPLSNDHNGSSCHAAHFSKANSKHCHILCIFWSFTSFYLTQKMWLCPFYEFFSSRDEQFKMFTGLTK